LLRPDKVCNQADRKYAEDHKIDYRNCDEMRIDSAMNVNIKVSGSLGGLSGQSSPNVSTGGASAGVSSGGEAAARKYSLCFSPRTKSAEDLTFKESRCGQPPRPYYHVPKTENAEVKKKDKTKTDEQEYVSYDQPEYDIPRDPAKIAFHILINKEMIDKMSEKTSLVPCRKDAFLCKLLAKIKEQCPGAEAQKKCAKGAPVSVEIDLRSTEGIIYYLGENVRRQLNPEYAQERRTIFFTNLPPWWPYANPAWRCRYPEPNALSTQQCVPIFELNAGPGSDTFLSTFYDGVVYSVPSGGRSGQVLEIVKQALALSSSSKSLPQSNVVSVVGGQ
jgi:hypothetical protein